MDVAGEIDMATAPSLSAAIGEALAAGALELWLDLTPTGFMDSTGVHALLAAQTQARDLNRRLAIICPPGHIRRLFDLAGVSGRLPIYDDRAVAHRGA